MKHILLGILAICLVASLTACSSSPSAAPTNAPAVSDTQAFLTETVSPTMTAKPTATPKLNNSAEAVKVIEQYMYDNFGTPGYEASWYDNIKSIEITGPTVIVKTNLYPKEENKQYARPIAVTIWTFFTNDDDFDNDRFRLAYVRVYGQGDRLIAGFP